MPAPPLDDLDIIIRTWGPLALFTRPDLHTQRVSYPLITPSAADGLVSCIYWKPELQYRVKRIGVVRLGGTMQLMRNELGDRQGSAPPDVSPPRQQRNSVMLTDVEYLLHVRPFPRFGGGAGEAMKHARILRDRLTRGQRFRTPYLGARECVASVELTGPDAEPDVNLNLDIGPLLFGQAMVPDPDGPIAAKQHRQRGGVTQGVIRRLTPHPLYLRGARIERGWLSVPPELYRRLNELEGRP